MDPYGNHGAVSVQFKCTHLIKDLNDESLNIDWMIKAKVMSKSRIIPPNRDRTETFFVVDLCDASGKIRMVAFRGDLGNTFETCYDMFELNREYYFSNLFIEAYRHPEIDNNYELKLKPDSKVFPCEEKTEVETSYDFTPLSGIPSLKASAEDDHTFVDIIGICVGTDDVVEQDERGIPEITRNIVLSDASGNTVIVHLRGPEAKHFDSSNNPVVAIKNGYVTSFKSSETLTEEKQILADSYVINPNIREACELLAAYKVRNM